MRHRFTLAAAIGVLTGGATVQAQHGHAHAHGGHATGHGGFGHGGYGHSGYAHGGYFHGGHGFGGHAHGHIHPLPLGGIYGYYRPGAPYAYRPAVSYPAAYPYPPVVAAPAVPPPVITPVGAVTTATSLKPNAIPPYAGPGVTLRLPAEYPGPVFVQVDKREVEVRPGTEVVFKDKFSYRVEFDRGGEFGTSSDDITEGVYKFSVADRGWFLLPDDAAAGGVRRNALPGEPKR